MSFIKPEDHRGESSFLPLLVAICLLLILIPLSEILPVMFAILASMVLLSGMLAVMRDRQFRWLVGTFLLVGLPLRWIAHFWGDEYSVLILLSHATVGIFFLILEYFVISRVISRQQITTQTVIGAVCGYLLIGLIFTLAFAILTFVTPSAIMINGKSLGAEHASNMEHHMSAVIYFSFVTLTTVGFGDIVPVSPLARSLVVIEAVAGQLYLAAFVARFVGLMNHTPHENNEN